MSWKPIVVSIVLVATVAAESAARAAGSDTDPFADAEAQAKAAEASPEGRKYSDAVGEGFGREHGPAFSKCAREIRRPDLSTFDLFLRVDAAGVVTETLARPATNLAGCIRPRVVNWKAGVPPHSATWVRVAVAMKRNS